MTAPLLRIPGLLLLACILHGVCSSQPPVAAIPDSLKKEAYVVKRMDETTIEIESPRKGHVHYLESYTILNSMGDAFATMYIVYDKFHKPGSASGTLYDAEGKVLKKIKKNDMEDHSLADGAGMLATDIRFKTYHFTCRSYPYTVTFEHEMDLDGLFILPQWQPQSSAGMAVENARLVVTAPSRYPLRYKQSHYPGEPVVTEKRGDKTYTWEISNRLAAQMEPYAPSWSLLTPSVYLAPGDFEIQGYKGNMYTWTDMGNFVHALCQGRDQLPEEARKKVHELTDGLTDEHEKINVLYRFLQKNSHYVSIQLGIGGWQPFDAAYVYNNRFGDCKALSNYMVALLKEAGVHSNYVLIKAGVNASPIDTSFASSQFNHAIVMARAGRDSVWLECTSQTLWPGYLGGFTCDRDALLIDESGGHIVHTPVYGLKENRLLRTVKGTIDSSGSLTASVHTQYTGIEQDAVHDVLSGLPQKEQMERARQSLSLPASTITDLSYRETGGLVPVVEESLQLKAENYATGSGSRLFLSPGNFLKKRSSLTNNRQPRKNNIAIEYSQEEVDSVVLQIPPGYTLEENIPPVNFTAPFGSYTLHAALSGQTLTITAGFRQRKGEYDAALFPRFVRFYELAHREDIQRIVLVKKR